MRKSQTTTANNMAQELFRTYERSIKFWPDPFQGIRVPGIETLKAFIEAPEGLDPDLREHLKEDVTCKRAVEKLKREGGPSIEEDTPWTPPAEGGVVRDPKPGEVYALKTSFHLWTGTEVTRRFQFMYTWVLILNSGIKTDYGDHIFRCIPVSPQCGPDARPGLHKLGGVWDAHVYLGSGYPVSTSQLLRRSDDEVYSKETLVEVLRAIREGSSNPPEKEFVELHLETFEVITANADARWAAWKGGKRLAFCHSAACGRLGVEGGECRCGHSFALN